MIEITQQDYRTKIVRIARAIYIRTGKTNNISTAVDMFLRDHPEHREHVPARITQREKDRPRTLLDDYVRPACSRCHAPLFLLPLSA